MNLAAAVRIYAQTAGAQTESAERSDEQTRLLLKRKQDKLDKMRRAVAPYPEDKREVLKGAVSNQDDLDVEDMRLRLRNKKGKRLCTNCVPTSGPGTTPLQPIQGVSVKIGKKKSDGTFTIEPENDQMEIKDIRAVIRHEGNRWCVRSEKSGKNLGCGPSKAWASRRLAQIEVFKKRGR